MTKDIEKHTPHSRAASVSLRMDAADKEFLSEAILGNEKEMAALREKLHALLDAKLDVLCEMAVLARQGQL